MCKASANERFAAFNLKILKTARALQIKKQSCYGADKPRGVASILQIFARGNRRLLYPLIWLCHHHINLASLANPQMFATGVSLRLSRGALLTAGCK